MGLGLELGLGSGLGSGFRVKVRVKGPEPTILHSMKIEKTSPWPICMPARAARRSSEGVHLVGGRG